MELTKEGIKNLLATNDAAVARALLALYARQTSDEQQTYTTKHQNGRGFSAFDAEILSSFAQQVERGRTLSPKQMAIARKRLPRYAGQLLEVALARQAAPAPLPAPRIVEQSIDDVLADIELKHHFARIERQQEAAVYLAEVE